MVPKIVYCFALSRDLSVPCGVSVVPRDGGSGKGMREMGGHFPSILVARLLASDTRCWLELALSLILSSCRF